MQHTHIRQTFYAVALSMTLGLGACASLASFTANTAANLSSSTPSQVSTLADAILVADTITRLGTVAVDTNTLDIATLTEAQALRAGIRAALDNLVADHAQGKSLVFASFNAALKAYKAYATEKGIAN